MHEERWTTLRPDRVTSHRTALVTVRIKCRSGKRGVRDGGKGEVFASCRQSNSGGAKVVSQNMQELRRLSEMYVYEPISFLFFGSVKFLCTVTSTYGSHGTRTGRFLEVAILKPFLHSTTQF